MNVLIIYAHPNPSSFNGAILEHVQKGLEETNHSVTLLDLYKEQFDPVLVFNGEKKRRDLLNEEETKRYRELVQKADKSSFHISDMVVEHACYFKRIYRSYFYSWICL